MDYLTKSFTTELNLNVAIPVLPKSLYQGEGKVEVDCILKGYKLRPTYENRTNQLAIDICNYDTKQLEAKLNELKGNASIKNLVRERAVIQIAGGSIAEVAPSQFAGFGVGTTNLKVTIVEDSFQQGEKTIEFARIDRVQKAEK
jgi:hypothetical protein